MGDNSSQIMRVVEEGQVPPDWNRMTVQELLEDGSLEFVQDGNHGGNYPKQDEFADAGIPLITGADIEGGVVNLRTCKFLKPDRAAKLRIGFSRTGDVLLSHKGTMGKTAIVPVIATPYIILNPQLTLYRVSEDGLIDRHFLKYFFDSALFQSFLTRISAISTISTLSLGIQKQLEICFPSKTEQLAIAHILGTLDDKIELNRRMNETLEAMARALFKSWFVDFDPVRAKTESRNPGLPKPLADLFPDSFGDSELGEIPKGWEVKRLGDLLELAYGKALKAEVRRDGNVPVFGSNGQVGWHDERLVEGPGIVVGRKGNPGVVTWASTDFFAIDTSFYVVPAMNCHSLHFLFHALKNHDLASLGADSAVPGLNRNMAYMSTQVLPSGPLLDKFDSYVNAIALRINANNEESRTLATLRDTLLPKLISGELRVKDAERVCERVGA